MRDSLRDGLFLLHAEKGGHVSLISTKYEVRFVSLHYYCLLVRCNTYFRNVHNVRPERNKVFSRVREINRNATSCMQLILSRCFFEVPVQPHGQEVWLQSRQSSRTASQAWRNTLTSSLFRLQGSRMDFGSRKTRRICRWHRRRRSCARNADGRTRWSATWRPTWNSSAAARGTSCVTCARLNTRRTSVCVVIFYRGTISTCRPSSRSLSASSRNKINE